MICKVIDTVEKYRLLENVKSVAVGVSGGADSMCLLHILSSLKDEYGIIIKAIHINHNLRGKEAIRDENFVRNYCLEKGIDLTVHSIDINSLSEELGIGTEECGRRVRYECFENAGCDAVAVAHSLSDSIETTVYNLLRGTGTKGLCGIPVRREPNIIRPLIFCHREEIEKYCEKENIPYITDSSNLTDDYSRNYIRHNIIPAFGRVNASFASNILRTSLIVNEENDFIEKSALALVRDAQIKNGYDSGVLLCSHSAVRKRAILLILREKMSKQPLYKHTELVNSIIENRKGKVEISTDMYAKVENCILSFVGPEETGIPWQATFKDGRAVSPYGTYLLINEGEKCKYKDAFDGGKLSEDPVLSSRREGDRFVFKKRNLSKSLKKIFNEMKIPQADREKIAVLRDGENIVWVEGVGVNSFYIPDENSEKIIVIKKDG